jgi:hypothetical protein
MRHIFLTFFWSVVTLISLYISTLAGPMFPVTSWNAVNSRAYGWLMVLLLEFIGMPWKGHRTFSSPCLHFASIHKLAAPRAGFFSVRAACGFGPLCRDARRAYIGCAQRSASGAKVPATKQRLMPVRHEGQDVEDADRSALGQMPASRKMLIHQ